MASSETIYRVLRHEILSLEFLPGQRIGEEILAERFGVSRTPVRMAISRLAAERLVTVAPRKGTFVAKIDFAYSRQLAFLRTAVEQRLLTELCQDCDPVWISRLEKNLDQQCELLAGDFQPMQFYRLDNQFHEIYFAAGQMAAVWKILQQFHVHYTRLRVMDIRISGCSRQFYDEHCRIVAMLRDGDADGVTSLIAWHLEGPLQRVRKFLDAQTVLQSTCQEMLHRNE